MAIGHPHVRAWRVIGMVGGVVASRGDGVAFVAVSTRRLILAALLCGIAILVAFTVQILVGR